MEYILAGNLGGGRILSPETFPSEKAAFERAVELFDTCGFMIVLEIRIGDVVIRDLNDLRERYGKLKKLPGFTS